MGTLYVVATPIGNLEDITLRAIRILQEADLIACEDSRITKRLLVRHEIDTPTISYHQHSGEEKTAVLLEKLRAGQSIALVTDAGTPGIQDPGGRLVRAVRNAQISVEVIPGPSALTAALSVAGISADSFYFVGFLPKKKGRQTLLKELERLAIPIVIYEAPPRVVKTLRDIHAYLGERKIIAARELTKKFEELQEGTVTSLLNHFTNHRPKGEFVIIVLPDIY
ncbi:16S rRNA (cytidine(1402)-2'-O)-methyltransferase [candidate division Kazan bacterium RBG_13_50_9]|uniref:Ribosomal RNA small subunit methyltransferase I n=1 Tax=candidate division Kazan bacterium RBG_13_50_9 TaxID=1798535 RepID=A0A1F4NS40_UNCK3|nr:MAG: 16S rRNA (cytidine(1402)-2'-O)-methyltransferase [candidate division Kazan bacterium RBG_13_50_9]